MTNEKLTKLTYNTPFLFSHCSFGCISCSKPDFLLYSIALFFKFYFKIFLLEYNLHWLESVNLKCTIQWLFTHVYSKVTTTQIKTEYSHHPRWILLVPFPVTNSPIFKRINVVFSFTSYRFFFNLTVDPLFPSEFHRIIHVRMELYWVYVCGCLISSLNIVF